MNERLKQFLTMEGLSPAKFADTMEIQRSGISHLLSGRNKPSFEFIQKILTAYPNLNPEWLILGKGKPYKDNYSSATPSPLTFSVPNEQKKAATVPSDLFSTEEDEETEDLPIFETETELQAELQESTITEEFIKPEIPSELSENQKSCFEPATVQEKHSKKISRITVFYNDGTFDER